MLENVINKTDVYISDNGEVMASSANAVAKLETTDNTLTYTALKSAPQSFSFGTPTDTLPWQITTSSGDKV